MANDQETKKEVEHTFIEQIWMFSCEQGINNFYQLTISNNSIKYFYSIVFMLQTAWNKWVAEFVGSN